MHAICVTCFCWIAATHGSRSGFGSASACSWAQGASRASRFPSATSSCKCLLHRLLFRIPKSQTVAEPEIRISLTGRAPKLKIYDTINLGPYAGIQQTPNLSAEIDTNSKSKADKVLAIRRLPTAMPTRQHLLQLLAAFSATTLLVPLSSAEKSDEEPRAPSPSKSQQPSAPPAMALIAPGFLIPGEQYTAYLDLLDELGLPAVAVPDQSSLRQALSLEEGARLLLAAGEAEMQRLGLDPKTPLVLVAHSRGAKVAISAASQSTRPVKALVLLDPVDATIYDNTTCMPAFSRLQVPTAILGSGLGGDCAPKRGNFERFYATLEESGAPRLLAKLPLAGHTQYLDRRADFLLDVCPKGKEKDQIVSEVARAVLAVWLGAFVPGCLCEASNSGSRLAKKQSSVAPTTLRKRGIRITFGSGNTGGFYQSLAKEVKEEVKERAKERRNALVQTAEAAVTAALARKRRQLDDTLSPDQKQRLIAQRNTQRACEACLAVLQSYRFPTKVELFTGSTT